VVSLHLHTRTWQSLVSGVLLLQLQLTCMSSFRSMLLGGFNVVAADAVTPPLPLPHHLANANCWPLLVSPLFPSSMTSHKTPVLTKMGRSGGKPNPTHTLGLLVALAVLIAAIVSQFHPLQMDDAVRVTGGNSGKTAVAASDCPRLCLCAAKRAQSALVIILQTVYKPKLIHSAHAILVFSPSVFASSPDPSTSAANWPPLVRE